MAETDISSTSTYFIDADGIPDSEIYSGASDLRFKHRATPIVGFSSNPAWIRIEADNPASREQPWILSFAYPLLDEVTVFHADEQGLIQSEVSGDGIPTSRRKRSSNGISFAFAEPPMGHSVYYVKITSKSSLQLNHFASSPAIYESATINQALIYALFFGSFIAMGLYNLSLAASTRSQQYLFYSLLVMFSVIREGYLSGLGYAFFWPESPLFNEYVGIDSMAMSIVLANIFVIQFLTLRTRAPWAFQAMRGMTWLSGVYIVALPFLGYSVIIRFLSMQVLLNSVLAIVVSCVQLKRGDIAARFLIAAWIFAIAGWTITAGTAYGALPFSASSKYANVCGQFLEIIFLSFALSDRINSLRKDKDAAIMALNKGLEEQVYEKTQDIQSILDSIPLGILRIDDRGCLKKGHSRFIEDLLAIRPPFSVEGLSLKTVLLSKSGMKSDEIAAALDVITSSVDQDALAWMINCHHLPARIRYDGRILDLQWTPVLSAGIVRDILLVAKDVTDLKIKEMEREATRKENEAIIAIVKTPEREFSSFTKERRSTLEAIAVRLNEPEKTWTKDDSDQTWRLLHTLKGESRSLGFRTVSAKIHDIESLLEQTGPDAIREDPAARASLKELIDETTAEIREYARIDQDVLKRSFSHGLRIPAIDVSCQVTALENLLMGAGGGNRAQFEIIRNLKALYLEDLAAIARNQLALLSEVATVLGKPLPKLNVTGKAYLFDDDNRELMESTLMHLFRNSLDHGIEPPAERVKKGKPSQGTIRLSLEEIDERVFITYWDDGRGLCLQRIRSHAIRKGLLPEDATPSADEIAALIFYPGFSTAERITEISGRGVGMDAVRWGIDRAQGSIRIVLDSAEEPSEAQFVTFHFEIFLKPDGMAAHLRASA